MRAVAKALKTFVGSFGLPAYTSESVPDDVQVPYLTYPLTEPEWNQKASFYIQGWFRTTSNAQLSETADQIAKAIGTGKRIKTDSGILVIYPESPLVQMNVDGDYRSFYMNFSINSYQMPGAYPEEGELNAET
ncbi:MAG: hypothetical protein J6S82_03640 [Bacteroidales bacterium]|nr:hypothetical protein [Bacteroidales bacterium]